jgi:1-acyl-sn-glycerol-3-phosphate acyltransferase
MIALRSLVFNVGFYLWTFVIGLYGAPLLLLPPRYVMEFGRLWASGALGLLAWTVGLRHEIRGIENLPDGAAIIALKHQSSWDTVILPVIFRHPAIVIKHELAWLPIYGWYAVRAGGIPVDRGAGASALKHMLARAKRAIAEDRPIAIFPEGTRTAVGARLPYHPGVAALYTQLAVPLVPVAVNSGVFWSRRSFLKFPGRIVLEILPAIPPGQPRRKVMAELETRIEAATARLVAEAQGTLPPVDN